MTNEEAQVLEPGDLIFVKPAWWLKGESCECRVIAASVTETYASVLVQPITGNPHSRYVDPQDIVYTIQKA